MSSGNQRCRIGRKDMSHKILFVDDDPFITEAFKRTLRKEPYEVLSANSADKALDVLSRVPVDIVISDEMMPGMRGTDFLAIVFREYPDTVRIILTGHANLDTAVRAINDGHIYRFLTKPCNEFELIVTLRQAIQHHELAAESRRLLKAFRKQNVVIRELEKDYPGILDVKTDSTGAIIIDDSETDVDALIGQINAEVTNYESSRRTKPSEEK
jgi:two-component system, probable response regulator PhcQ